MQITSAYLKQILGMLALYLGLVTMASADTTDTIILNRYFVSSDGVRMHYLEAGTGRTIVFVPGWVMPSEIWERQIAYFARKYRVIAFDPRSQGESDIASSGYEPRRRAQDIYELIQASSAGSVVLVGWSLGVLESLAYVNFFGDQNIDALVLVDNSIGEGTPPQKSNFLERLKQNREATISAFVRAMYKTPQTDAYLERITRFALKTPLDASVALLSYNYPRKFWHDSVYATTKPILYAVTKRFEDQSISLKKNRPAATVEVFENAGHALFVDEEAHFNSLVEGFLREHLL